MFEGFILALKFYSCKYEYNVQRVCWEKNKILAFPRWRVLLFYSFHCGLYNLISSVKSHKWKGYHEIRVQLTAETILKQV